MIEPVTAFTGFLIGVAALGTYAAIDNLRQPTIYVPCPMCAPSRSEIKWALREKQIADELYAKKAVEPKPEVHYHITVNYDDRKEWIANDLVGYAETGRNRRVTDWRMGDVPNHADTCRPRQDDVSFQIGRSVPIPQRTQGQRD